MMFMILFGHECWKKTATVFGCLLFTRVFVARALSLAFMGLSSTAARALNVMLKMERWMAEHRADPRRSRLRRLVPNLGFFFIPLKHVEAFRE